MSICVHEFQSGSLSPAVPVVVFFFLTPTRSLAVQSLSLFWFLIGSGRVPVPHTMSSSSVLTIPFPFLVVFCSILSFFPSCSCFLPGPSVLPSSASVWSVVVVVPSSLAVASTKPSSPTPAVAVAVVVSVAVWTIAEAVAVVALSIVAAVVVAMVTVFVDIAVVVEAVVSSVPIVALAPAAIVNIVTAVVVAATVVAVSAAAVIVAAVAVVVARPTAVVIGVEVGSAVEAAVVQSCCSIVLHSSRCSTYCSYCASVHWCSREVPASSSSASRAALTMTLFFPVCSFN